MGSSLLKPTVISTELNGFLSNAKPYNNNKSPLP
jgi:hypothetical protein